MPLGPKGEGRAVALTQRVRGSTGPVLAQLGRSQRLSRMLPMYTPSWMVGPVAPIHVGSEYTLRVVLSASWAVSQNHRRGGP